MTLINRTKQTVLNIYNNPHFVGIRAGIDNFLNYPIFDFRLLTIRNILLFYAAMTALILPIALLITPAIATATAALSLMPAAFMSMTLQGLIITVGITEFYNALSYLFNFRIPGSSLVGSSIRAGVDAANEARDDTHDFYTVGEKLSKKNAAEFVADVVDFKPPVVNELAGIVKDKTSTGVNHVVSFARDNTVGVRKVANDCVDAAVDMKDAVAEAFKGFRNR